jgi:hypothetical protein
MSGLQSKAPLTAPKEGADARVGQELGDPMGWLIRRTKRAEELIAEPSIMALCDEAARHVERYAFVEEIELRVLEPEVLRTRSKSYITIAFGARDCVSCKGVGQFNDGRVCQTCDGSGKR